MDRTGITRKFNFRLEFAPEPSLTGPPVPGAANPALPADSGPSLFVALREQIGLRLSPEKGPVNFLIIDRVEKPAAN